MNVLGYFDRVRFTLYTERFGSLVIDEPEGWDEDDKEYSRNNTYNGIISQMSNNLTFVGNAVDYIKTVKDTDDVIADLRLTKEERNPKTDVWEIVYFGYLDLFTYSEEDGKIKLKFNSGGLESILKSRESEDVEIDRNDTIDGNILSQIETVDVYLQGRNIFLESIWKAAPMSYYKQLYIESRDGNRRSGTNTLPFDIVKKSHEQAQMTVDGLDGNEGVARDTMMLLLNMDRPRDITINVEDLSFHAYNGHTGSVNNGYVAITLGKYYYDGSDYRPINESMIKLWNIDFVNNGHIPSQDYNLPNSSHTFHLEAGESLGIAAIISVDFRRTTSHWNKRSLNYKLKSGKITIRENSEFEPSTIKAVKPFYLANRLAEIITNRKNIVKSNLLHSGKWKDVLVTHGFWIRNFSKERDSQLPENERKFKPITTSFKDFIESYSAMFNIGLGIEKNGYSEQIVIESLDYFYSQNVTIKLPNNVSKVKRTVEQSNYYKSIEIGFEKGGQYEEAMGLDEYNVRNTYSTIINKGDTTYSMISKYRADSYGIEFARRKPFDLYSTEDTSFDTDVFVIDAKKSGLSSPISSSNTYLPRLWNDDFNTIPTGVYSPETAFNLRTSPFNDLIRHGWTFGGCLTKYPDGKIKYKSSSGNSKLKTIYPENGEIQNNQLDSPKFTPDIVEFEHEVDFEISKMLSGKSVFNGIEIPNMYGLIEFKNEFGEIERGFLLSVKPNGAGKWKIIKSYR